MEITDRLHYIMKINNLSASEFADKIEVQRSSMSHIFSGRNKPSLEFIQKVLAAFPKVSADWLLAGTTSSESILPETAKPNIETTVEEKSSTTPTPTQNGNKQVKKVVIFYTDNTFEEIIKS